MPGIRNDQAKLLSVAILSACLTGVLSFLHSPATQAQTPPASSAVSSPALLVPAKPVKPLWVELSPQQQEALGALAPNWDKLDAPHKQKWLKVSEQYKVMTPEKKALFQTNLREWVKLTPEQRRLARETNMRVKHLDADKKSEHWQNYQQLPDEQKQELADASAAKTRVANLPAQKTPPKIVAPLKPVTTKAAAPAASVTAPASAAPAATATGGTNAPSVTPATTTPVPATK